MSNCYVYIWNHTAGKYWGFYNLCIHDTISISGYTLKNPVFSYCPDSKLRIYPNEKLSTYYPANEWSSGYDLWRFTFSSSKVADFISNLGTAVDTSTISRIYNSASDYYLECNLLSGNIFYQYDEIHHNAFEAVARWANWLGMARLLTEYTSAHNNIDDGNRYLQYIPKALYNSIGKSNWQKTEYDTSPTTP